MDVEELVMVWADDHRLDIEWGYDAEDSKGQYHFYVRSGFNQNALNDLEYVLDHINYVVDEAYDISDGVLIEIAPY